MECMYLLTVAKVVPFNHGMTPTLLNRIECTGMEDHPLNCSYNEIDIQDCPSLKNAGVICRGNWSSELLHNMVTDDNP